MTADKPSSCYWWNEAPPRPAPDAPWPAATDVAVVGCGYTGLSAALTLARAGRDVVVLEKGLVGEGASTRNGGITSGNIRLSASQLERRFGPERAQLFLDEAVAARADLWRFLDEEGVDCDQRRCGRVLGLQGGFSPDRIRNDIEAFESRYGIRPELVDREGMAEYTCSTAYGGGILRPDIGGIHPAKLLHEMARLAGAAGATIFSETPVLAIHGRKAEFTLETAKGSLKAQHVISATNAYTDDAQPWLRRRLIPVVSEMIATEKLGANRVRSLMPRLTMFSESKQLGYYYRPSPDGERILLGGRRMHGNADQARRRLHQGLAGIFPELAEARIEAHWGGFVAFPFDQLPKLAVHDGIIYPTGFCGSGTVWARWLGQKAALMILGEEAGSAFGNLPMGTVPFYRGDPWFLPLAMAYYKMRDRMAVSTK